jgi:hypothetical protein
MFRVCLEADIHGRQKVAPTETKDMKRYAEFITSYLKFQAKRELSKNYLVLYNLMMARRGTQMYLDEP